MSDHGKKLPFSVMGFYEDNGRSFLDHVFARDPQHAIWVTAQSHPTVTLICAQYGHLTEGRDIHFAGESAVDAETVLSQEDVFCGMGEYTPPPLSDIVIQDPLKASLFGDTESLDQLQPHRLKVSLTDDHSALEFALYPHSLDSLHDIIPKNGIAGRIEVRNGRPAMSLGLAEGELPIHIESDVFAGFDFHTDPFVTSKQSFYDFNHGESIAKRHFKLASSEWLHSVRRILANKAFEEYDFGNQVIQDSSGWEISDSEWKQTLYIEDPDGGDSMKERFNVQFSEGFAIVEAQVNRS